MFNTIFYYICTSSIILIYGVGLNRLLTLKNTVNSIALSCVKALCTSSVTVLITTLLVNSLLAEAQLTELYPFIAIIIFIVIGTLVEIFVSIGVSQSLTEFALPMLTVLVAVSEGLSPTHSIIICFSCIAAFYIFLIFIASIRRRIMLCVPDGGIKEYTLMLISLGIVVIASCAWNVSWLNSIGMGE